MANKKISQLTSAGALADANEFAIVQSATTYKGTPLQMFTYMQGKFEAADITWTGAHDFGGATSLELPNGAAPTVNADGEIALDTTVTDWSHGIIKYYGGEEMAILAVPVAQLSSPADNDVVLYNATTDELELQSFSEGGIVQTAGSNTDNAIPLWNGTDNVIDSSPLSYVSASNRLTTSQTVLEIEPNSGSGANVYLTSSYARVRSPNDVYFLETSNSGIDIRSNNVTRISTDITTARIWSQDNSNYITVQNSSIYFTMNSASVFSLEDASVTVTGNADLRFVEKADHTGTPAAGYGYLWVRSDTPNVLVFTDDAGTDWDLNTSGGISNVVEDTTPQLGGSFDVNGNKIVSVSNGNIDIEPHGTGNVLLGNFVFDADQTVGAGQDNYVLTYDNGTGLISLEAASGSGGDVTAASTITDNSIVRGDGGAKGVQESSVTIDDLANMDGVNNLTAAGNVQVGGNLNILDSGGDHTLTIAPTEDYASDRVLNITINDANRTIDLAGDFTLAAAFTTSGANSLTLTTTGATNVTLPTSGTLLANVSEDTTPQLGGNLDVDGNSIVSTSNGDITLAPNGTGDVVLGNFTVDADATVGAGQDGYLWSYDHSSGKMVLTAAAGGGNVSNTGTPADGQIAVWTDATTIEGSSTLTWDGASGSFDTSFTSISITTNSATSGALYINATDTQLYSPDSANYITVNNTDVVVSCNSVDLLEVTDNAVTVTTGADLAFDEKADHSNAPGAGEGRVWLRSDTPNVLVFTDDAGTDWDLNQTRTGVYRDLFIPAGAMIPRTTNGAEAATVELATNDVMYDALDFDTATEEGVGFWVHFGSSFDAGTVKAQFYWTAASGSGTVKFDIAAQSYADSDALDQALGTEQSATDTLITANDMHISPVTSALTIADATNGEPIYFQVTRDVSTDTLGVDARLIGVRIQFLETSTEPSIIS